MGKGWKGVLVPVCLALALWSAAYAQVSPPFWTNDCTTPWGGIVQGGASVTAYASCTSSETRTCNGGVLSGSYIYGSAASSCSGGSCVGGYCWYASSGSGYGESCHAACASRGGCNLEGTKNYAGSGGTNQNCNDVITALGFTPTYGIFSSAASNIGCAYQTFYSEDNGYFDDPVRYTKTTLCCATAHRRACACNNGSSGTINGACGPAYGSAAGSAPTTGLCNMGTASAVSGSGPWTWTCNGASGGGNANCTTAASTTPTGCPNPGEWCSDGTIFAGSGLYLTDVAQSTAAWATVNESNSGAQSLTDGEANQAWIIANRTLSNYPAFQSCENMVRHGHGDWYLPARDEVTVLYNNRTAIGLYEGAMQYWTSSEANSSSARSKDFINGSNVQTPKDTGTTIRCVRKP